MEQHIDQPPKIKYIRQSCNKTLFIIVIIIIIIIIIINTVTFVVVFSPGLQWSQFQRHQEVPAGSRRLQENGSR